MRHIIVIVLHGQSHAIKCPGMVLLRVPFALDELEPHEVRDPSPPSNVLRRRRAPSKSTSHMFWRNVPDLPRTTSLAVWASAFLLVVHLISWLS